MLPPAGRRGGRGGFPGAAGRAWPRLGGFYACASATLLLMDSPTDPAPFRSLAWTGWTMCLMALPAPGTRCYLRVRVSLDLGNDLVEEVWAPTIRWVGSPGAAPGSVLTAPLPGDSRSRAGGRPVAPAATRDHSNAPLPECGSS